MTTKIFFLILFFGGLWLILDDFNGKRRISRIADRITNPIDFTWRDLIPTFKLPWK